MFSMVYGTLLTISLQRQSLKEPVLVGVNLNRILLLSVFRVQLGLVSTG